ncbi:MAG: NAD(P)-binding domain-containing protein [Pseudomonadota bacterium]
MANSTFPCAFAVAVIGAGPIGLAAAAHLVGRGLAVEVFEAGAGVAAHLQSYGHVRLFSPWRYNVDTAARALLESTEWAMPDPDGLPTAGELVERYLGPLAAHRALAPHIHFGHQVLGISRAGFDKLKTAGREHADFVLAVQTAEGVKEIRAQAVIDASGTWGQPNPMGIHGFPAMGERAVREHMAYGMPDILGAARGRYAGRSVLVVGAGHSAAGNLLALAALADEEPGTRVHWAVRGKDLRKVFGGGSADGLPARGALGTRLRDLVGQQRIVLHLGFGAQAVEMLAGRMTVRAIDPTVARVDGVDEIIVAAGSRPDLSPARELRTRLDPWIESTAALADLIDPNLHSCGTVRPHGHKELAHPEPGFYAIGAKSYGRAPNFLMATGYEQARSVVAAIAGDWVAANQVQLDLPQTGVCSVDISEPATGRAAAASSCCGGPAVQDRSACCALDEARKAPGSAGCGCTAAAAPASLRGAPARASCCG